MDLPTIDYFNQGIYNPPSEDNICLICHDILDVTLEQPTQDQPQSNLPYALECKHKYHANCIITWFRSGHANCPYCGDNGVNYPKKSGERDPILWGRQAVKARVLVLRRYSKKKEAPNELVKMLDRLQIMEENYDKILSDIKEFTKTQFHDVTFKEVHSRRMALLNKKWKIRRSIFDHQKSIYAYPIIPLIIPKILT
jgi:hypothetical protein